MGKSRISLFSILITVAIGLVVLSGLLMTAPELNPTEARASTLGDFFKKVFPGLKPIPRRQVGGGGEATTPPGTPEDPESFENWQPGPPPTLEEMGNNEEISDAPPENSVTIDRFGMCRIVTNTRGDIFSVMIPHLIEEEWMSFIENPPEGIVLRGCTVVVIPTPTPSPTPVGPTPTPTGLCGIDLHPDDIYAVVGNLRLDFTPLPPMPGIAPRISARPASINFICEAMGCGPPEWIAYRTYSSPENNAIVRWTGTQWEKVRATAEPSKIDGCPATGERMLRCSAPGSPAGTVQRRNCD